MARAGLAFKEIGVLGPLSLMAGVALASLGVLPPWFWWTSLGLAGLVLFWEVLSEARHTVALLALSWLCIAAGGLWMAAFGFTPAPSDPVWLGDQPHATVEGRVVATGNSPTRWIIHAETVDGRVVNGQILADVAQPLRLAERVALTGKLYEADPAHYPGGFDYRSYLRHQHITMRLKAYSAQVLDPKPANGLGQIQQWADTLRHQMTDTFKSHMPPPSGEILASMVLGEHAVGLTPDVKQAFQGAGLIHILAASGMNVALVGGLFVWLGGLCRLPWRLKFLLAMASVAFYGLLTGLPPSVLRAGTMFELALLLKLIRRDLDPVMLLCLAGGLLTLMNPDIVSLTGFQLSFLSAFGLLALMPTLQRDVGFYITQWGAGILLAPVIAQLWVSPILWSQFQQVQVLALPANILVLPVVAILTYLGFTLGLLAMVWPSATGFVLPWLAPLVNWTAGVARGFASHPASQWVLPQPPLAMTIWMLAGLFLWAWAAWTQRPITRRDYALGIGVWLLGILVPFAVWKADVSSHTQLVRFSPEGTHVAWLVIPHAEAPILLTPSLSRSLLWDVSGYLKSQGFSGLDTLVLTRDRALQSADLEAVAAQLPFHRIVISPFLSDSSRARVAAFAQSGAHPLLQLNTTTVLQAGPAKLTLYTMPQSDTIALMQTRTCHLLSPALLLQPAAEALQETTHCLNEAQTRPESGFVRWVDAP